MNVYILQNWTDERYPHIIGRIPLADCLTLLEKNKQRNFKINIISPFYV